jgi:RimJ/RimL family protein N-acetyltransferase
MAGIESIPISDLRGIVMISLPARHETPRLHLRPPAAGDAEALFAAYCQDPLVCRYLEWAPHGSVADTRAFLARCVAGWPAGTPLTWVLGDRGGGPPFGMLEARVRPHAVELGYVLARARWGQGLMAEAVAAVTAAALGHPGCFRVQALVDAENRASARVLETAGFRQEGRLARYGVHPNMGSEPRDVFMYARTT